MGHVRGESRDQSALFPVSLDELIPADHVSRVIDAFVARLDLGKLGFAKASPAATGRPPYDPADLLKLYVYGYLQQVRSSRRLEAECKRNVEVMWLLGRLATDHKTIAKFLRTQGEALRAACAAFVRFLREAGVVGGEWVAIDGSKFRAAASRKAVPSIGALERQVGEYLVTLDASDAADGAALEPAPGRSRRRWLGLRRLVSSARAERCRASIWVITRVASELSAYSLPQNQSYPTRDRG